MGAYRDAFEERIERADHERGEEYRRELAEDRVAEQAPKCAHLRCTFPAVVGSYCGLHSGMELRSRQAGTRVSV